MLDEMSIALLVLGLLLAPIVWAFLFHGQNEALAVRTAVAALALGSFAIGALALTHDLDDALGPVTVVEVVVGLGVGLAWLAATHVGHLLLCRFVPGFLDQVTDLYRLQAADRSSVMVLPVLAMGVAEELYFRGFIQGVVGLAGAVVFYGAVQVSARNWALVVAALLGGLVWGLLRWWRGGLLAPIAAHLLWTGSLLFVWPLRGCGRRRGAADVTEGARGGPVTSTGTG
jgi:membrane protease YdiL (CAAX protease family)